MNAKINENGIESNNAKHKIIENIEDYENEEEEESVDVFRMELNDCYINFKNEICNNLLII